MNCLSLVYSGNISEFSSEIFGSLRKSSEMIGNVRVILGLLSDNFGADLFLSELNLLFGSEFFTVSVKMPKI